MINTRNVVLITTSLILIGMANSALAIKKCQDKDGNWHYGDLEVEACKTSKVTTLDERGIVKDVRAAPKTDDELAAEAKIQEVERKEAERNKKEEDERNRILSIYETEADIERQRNNQLYSVQSNIDVHEAYIASLKERQQREEGDLAAATHPDRQAALKATVVETKQQIKSYEKQLADLRQQKKDIMVRFEQELALYRELTKPKQ